MCRVIKPLFNKIAFFICIVLIFKSTSAFSQVDTQDSLTLVDFYNSTLGPNWNNHSGWLTSKPVSTWYGVTVSSNRVTSIVLSRNSLSGSLPSTISNLSNLQTLDLPENYQIYNQLAYSLSGDIPESFGKMTNLKLLNLEGNGFSGNIPASLGNMSSLQNLNLGYNHYLAGSIPSSFGQLANLTDLNIEACSLTGELLASLLNLPKLENLNLWLNQISGNVPAIISRNSNMKTIFLGANAFTGNIPPSLSLYTNLLVLDLSDNMLSGSVPASIGQLSKLNGLYLENNQLSDSVPATLLQLNNIQNIYLTNNLFTFAGIEGIAAKFGNNTTDYLKLISSYAKQSTLPLHSNAGKLSVSAGGSVGNETFSWYKDGFLYKTIVGDSTFTVTESGLYFVMVTNKIATELVLSSNALYANNLKAAVTISNETCGNKNGSITAEGIGGTPPYQYSIDGTNFQNSNIFKGLVAGVYTVTIKDSAFLIGTTTDSITNTHSPVVNIGNDTTLCQGQSVLLESPGETDYKYLWQDGSTANYFKAVTTGKYKLTVTNGYGCSVADSVQIQFNPLPFFTLGSDTTLCQYSSINYNFSLPNATFKWNDGSIINTYTINQAGRYWLEVTQNGCVKTDTVNILYKQSPVVYLGNDTTLCSGITKILNAFNNNATYVWQDGSQEPSYHVSDAGLYFVTVDINGCKAADSVNIEVINKPVFTLGKDTSLCSGATILLTPSPSLNAITAYLWQDGSTASTYTVQSTGLFYLTVSNQCGMFTGSVNVGKGLCYLLMPSAFSPNRDGLNDIFRVKYPFPATNFTMLIYNRFGQKVFETQNINNGWNGTINGTEQPTGTYVWMIKYTDWHNVQQAARGTVSLIR